MKYYIYISDTKVDMLYSQIPKSMKSKIAAEFKIDLKVLGGTIKRETTDETRYSKLRMVVDYIEKNLDVGTVDEPRDYFKGTLPMKWGLVSGSLRSIVYFGGSTERTNLGLGGSSKHLIGFTGDKNSYFLDFGSNPHHILYVLEKELLSQNIFTLKNEENFNRKQALFAVHFAAENLGGPTQQIDFLAKRLIEEESPSWGNKCALLGSPIYLALAN